MANAPDSLTFEEVDKHFQSADLSAFQQGGRHNISASMTAAPAAAIPNVCAIYKIVRPFLVLATSFPIPAKWKAAIKLFIQAMDTFCP